MRVLPFFLAVGGIAALATSALASERSTSLLIQNQSNAQLKVMQYQATSGKFTQVITGIGSMGQAQISSENDQVLTGTSGWIELYGQGIIGDIVIQWDNPYIGSNSYKFSAPGGWQVFAIKGDGGWDGSGNDAKLVVRIEGRATQVVQRPPNVTLGRSGYGVVRGRVLWPTTFGAPSEGVGGSATAAKGAAAQPRVTIGLGGPWSLFKFTASQPTIFQPWSLAGSATARYYQGSLGEFLQPASAGKVSFAKLESPVPGYDGFAFTISNLPTGVPVGISVAPNADTSWQLRATGTSIIAINQKPTQPVFYCVGSNVEADLVPQMYDIAGFDFTVNAEWVPSGTPLASMRGSTSSSKSLAQFGILDSGVVAGLAGNKVGALPAAGK